MHAYLYPTHNIAGQGIEEERAKIHCIPPLASAQSERPPGAGWPVGYGSGPVAAAVGVRTLRKRGNEARHCVGAVREHDFSVPVNGNAELRLNGNPHTPALACGAKAKGYLHVRPPPMPGEPRPNNTASVFNRRVGPTGCLTHRPPLPHGIEWRRRAGGLTTGGRAVE